jgi:hypothetical protein
VSDEWRDDLTAAAEIVFVRVCIVCNNMPLKHCELIGFIYSHKTFTQLHIARIHNNSIFQNFKLWDI